jgi:hypothetical protein
MIVVYIEGQTVIVHQSIFMKHVFILLSQCAFALGGNEGDEEKA